MEALDPRKVSVHTFKHPPAPSAYTVAISTEGDSVRNALNYSHYRSVCVRCVFHTNWCLGLGVHNVPLNLTEMSVTVVHEKNKKSRF